MKLDLLEKFILLAHHPEKRRFLISDLPINYGLIGAMLLDMSLEERIDIQNDDLILKDHRNISNPMIAEIATTIHQSKKKRKVKYWVMKFGQKASKYKRRILESLEKKNIIEIERKKFLGLIPYIKTNVSDRRLRDRLVQEVRENVLNRRDIADEDTLMLGLVESCKMYRALSADKEEIKRMKANLKDILKDSPIADSIDKTVKQVQSAIIVSVIASSTAATAANSAT